MRRTRKPYPAEFTEQLVALARSGRSVESLAREFEPCAATIHGWVKQVEIDVGDRNVGLMNEERSAQCPFDRGCGAEQADCQNP